MITKNETRKLLEQPYASEAKVLQESRIKNEERREFKFDTQSRGTNQLWYNMTRSKLKGYKDKRRDAGLVDTCHSQCPFYLLIRIRPD